MSSQWPDFSLRFIRFQRWPQSGHHHINAPVAVEVAEGQAAVAGGGNGVDPASSVILSISH